MPRAELEAHVAGLAARHGVDGLLVFDDTGITGHGGHKAASLPALACTLPDAIASQLQLQGNCEHLRWIEPGGSARMPPR